MNQRRKSDRRGNMPFALVAVTILLVASSYCVVSASVRETEQEEEGVQEQIDTLDDSVDSTRSFIESGIGNIIYTICTDPALGNLQKRSSEFDERAKTWMEFQFPMDASGVTAKLIDYELNLRTENMTLDSDKTDVDGYIPSFLRAVGYATVEFESEVGNTTKTIEVSSDGSCALPLAINAGSLFSNAVSGEGSALTQMIEYQLTSLAQFRVINGYGAFSTYGDKGTYSIITEQDVKNAYQNAIRSLECLYFRDSSGETVFGSTDLAKTLLLKSGYVTVDLNSVYAQALYSKMDDIVGKWFDYFFGNKLIELFDKISDVIKNAWDSFTSFITGKNNFSAEPYLKEIIGDIYTGIYSGKTHEFTVTDSTTGKTVTYTVDYPDVDLYGSDVIKNFKNNYRNNTNAVRDWITNLVNAAITKVANGKGLGTADLRLDSPESFPEVLTNAITAALAGNMESFENITKDMLQYNKLPDQFYSAIYYEISSNRDSIFTYSESSFNNHIRTQVFDSVNNDFRAEDGSELPQSEIVRIISESTQLESNRETAYGYQKAVDSLMEKLDALNEVEAPSDSMVKKICIAMLSVDFFALDLTTDISSVANAMCQEYKTYMEINPYCGTIDLPDTDEFVLQGDSRYTEKLSVTETSNPDVSVGRPDKDKSVHYVGFDENSKASFTTVIPVKIKDTFSYKVDSAGTLMSALGISDSSYADSFTVDISTEIVIVSGWGLQGVDYGSSTNVLLDVYNKLISFLEPLLEPLRKIMHMAEELIDKLSQALVTITQYLEEIIEKIYNTLIEPMEQLREFITKSVTEWFCNKIVDFAENAKAIVDVSMVEQTVGISYMGYTLTFSFNLKTLEKYTKHIVKAEFAGEVNGVKIGAYLNIKSKGDTDPVRYVTGGFELDGTEWKLSGTIDPYMTTNKNLISISGTVKGVQIDATLPKIVEYHEIGIALSDFPGISTILSNIPSPIPGTKVNIDAGVSLKYNLPIKTGVLINEFESNPEGTDKDNEWAEVINLSGSAVDLTDWTITTSKNKVHIIKDVKLAPGERAVIEFEGTFLLNSKEYLILKDPDGAEMDRTDKCTDSKNNSRTFQRLTDGCTKWGMAESTRGESNNAGIFTKDGVGTQIVLDIVKTAAVKAMTEMKHVYTVEGLEQLFTKTIQYAIDDGIGRISECVVEGSIYVSVDFTDLTSSGRSGFKAYVSAGSEFAGDVLKYLLGKAEALFLNIDDPYNIDIDSVVYDDVYVGVSVYGGIKLPAKMSASTDEKVTLGVDIAVNLSAIGGLFGCELGTPKVKASIGIKNCPYEVIPSALKPTKNMTYDYYFMTVKFTAVNA